MKNISAYIAGAIDCDGSITIARQRRKGKDGYTPRITLTNTNKPIVEVAGGYFRRITGGRMSVFIADSGGGRQKPLYRVATQSIGGCRKVLKEILPYLVCKDEQAKLLLSWLELPKRTSANSEKYWEKILSLNK